ncbi:hypothetical protein [Caenispirillum salinarum]|uniref:hypothetical protein n=1 Tax=Caenispirillum salinarum TaxID=859058 RepID=UPI0038513B30
MTSRTTLIRAMLAGLMAGAAALPAAAIDDDTVGPYGGLEGEALEAAREGADGDPYVDPDNDPTRDSAEDQDALLGPPPTDIPLEEEGEPPGLLGDGEIVIKDGEVVEGLFEE